MPRLPIPPTKSNLLEVRHQLAFATEGYDLLEQKRRILLVELLTRARSCHEAERTALDALAKARTTLREALLDAGADAIDAAAVGVGPGPDVTLGTERVMGLSLPRASVAETRPTPRFGPVGATARTHEAMERFREALPCWIRYAERETAVLRLSQELAKTQRRCNALSRLFIPTYRDTVSYIASTLEERERESIALLKRIRHAKPAPG